MLEKGDSVILHYTIKLEDGDIIETTLNKDPINIKYGDTSLIKGFDNALKDANEGDNIHVNIAAKDAYGVRKDDLIYKVKKEQLPPNIVVGQVLRVENKDIFFIAREMKDDVIIFSVESALLPNTINVGDRISTKNGDVDIILTIIDIKDGVVSFTTDKKNFPNIKIGESFAIKNKNNIDLIIKKIYDGGSADLDGNHPLADKNLIFDINILKIIKKDENEENTILKK